MKLIQGSFFTSKVICGHIFFVISLFLLIIGLQNIILFQKVRWALNLAERTHMFVVSSFYYESSKSLPPNTIAIIYAARKHVSDFPIMCHSQDAFGRHREAPARTDMALVAPVQCKWTVMVALCPVVNKPVKFALEGDRGKTQVLPFQPADSVERRFVVCMSRMFLFENWQLLISSLEIYRYYGADLIVTYLDSLLSDIYTILRAYEKEGFLKLKPAVRFIKPKDIDYDPNAENEWYNQDATYNSCLYEFKDSAQFILIADWDDVLVPNSHKTYGDEMLWLSEMHPQAASFIFQRPQTTLHTSGQLFVIASHSPARFDLKQMIDTAVTDQNDLVTGKFVGRPARIDGIWLHAPTRVRPGYEVIELGTRHALVHHFRRWNFIEKMLKPTLNRTYIAPGDSVNNSFNKFLARNNLTQTFLHLPNYFAYYNKLTECYKRFASLLDHHSMNACPSLPKCQLPVKANHSCMNLEQHYTSTNLLNGFVIHHSVLDEYVETKEACRTNTL
ncbi:Glycosyltransferase family 92 protein [Aphelenchoides bicaudatus]|nr:Glycosyltransferase family 92 protein [Aphelenchoides bicaudatus]